ncbi:MAG: hypothetical protein RLZ44_761, partial [Pseudomonadota bacterium]
PFYQACGQCHRTASAFPPNFLAGPPDTVIAQVTHCAPRIKYRLGMWGLDAARRPKTPMPPQHALSQLDTNPERWAGGAQLAALQQSLEALVGERGGSLPAAADLLSRDYAGLPTCLPGS